MSEDVTARLRALAHDHFEGRLSLAAYRRLRGPLLDSLAGAPLNEPAVTTQPRSVLRQPAPSIATLPPAPGVEQSAAPPQAPRIAPPVAAAVRAAPAPVSLPSPPAAPEARGGFPLLAVIGVVIVGAVAVGGYLYWRSTHAGSGASVSVVAPKAPGGEVYAVVAPLLDSEDWSEARLAETNAALLKAGAPAIATAASTEWFQRFTDAVRRRLKEQQALAPSGSVSDSGALSKLAVTIGLDLKAPDSPIRIATAPTEPPEPPGQSGSVAEGTPPQARPSASAPRQAGGSAAAASAHGAPAASVAHSGSATPSTRPPAAAPVAASAAAQPAIPPASAPAATTCRAELGGTRRPYCQDVLGGTDLGPQLAVVPAGAFDMGNPDVASERPVHHVTIAKPFAISVQEVSQGEFRLFCQRTGRACPAQPWSGDDYPVVDVSWADAHAYAEWLSRASGHPYRLPSEAEWEYAARAGHTGLFPSGDSLSPTDVYYSATSTLTSPAPRSRHFNANDWHLLNMVGNVREWVEDSWSPNLEGAPGDGSARTDHDVHVGVVRGGAYADLRQKLRLTTREPLSRDAHDALTGIRLVRVVD